MGLVASAALGAFVVRSHGGVQNVGRVQLVVLDIQLFVLDVLRTDAKTQRIPEVISGRPEVISGNRREGATDP